MAAPSEPERRHPAPDGRTVRQDVQPFGMWEDIVRNAADASSLTVRVRTPLAGPSDAGEDGVV